MVNVDRLIKMLAHKPFVITGVKLRRYVEVLLALEKANTMIDGSFVFRTCSKGMNGLRSGF